VIDEGGVLGQVTRVHALVSEVTLVTDRDQATPVLNVRSGVRSVVYGEPSGSHAGSLELRFMPANADVQSGDLLTTSGVDGVYPPGLPVARIDKVERRADTAFARIHATPQALAGGTRHVMVLTPTAALMPPRPPAEDAVPVRKGPHR
jgi:rod shape-determining protein MreC